ncbi:MULTISPECIES: chorismate mutase [Streptomyces]|uniref:Chorismate mutase n=1 Tax=Streptomyces chilikensis TaxID=1194079 RepID=A0ABV3EVZ4_9ACTN|nr:MULTISPECIES: chorismate mutase [Streptomyces]MDH6226745.1 chorismate mutase [Streptomyces sp. MJP52]
MSEDIAALDREIIALVGRRADMAGELAGARASAGGSRTSLAEENRMIDRYRHELGRPGVNLALVLLSLSSRRPA